MKASVLAAKLLQHPNLDVTVLDLSGDSIVRKIVAVQVDSIDVDGVVVNKKLAIEIK